MSLKNKKPTFTIAEGPAKTPKSNNWF